MKRTNGNLIAMEKAVIFLLAVTPFNVPEDIFPVKLIIFWASIITAYTSTPRIKIIVQEINWVFFLINKRKIPIRRYISNTLACREILTTTSVGFIAYRTDKDAQKINIM